MEETERNRKDELKRKKTKSGGPNATTYELCDVTADFNSTKWRVVKHNKLPSSKVRRNGLDCPVLEWVDRVPWVGRGQATSLRPAWVNYSVVLSVWTFLIVPSTRWVSPIEYRGYELKPAWPCGHVENTSRTKTHSNRYDPSEAFALFFHFPYS